MTDTFWNVLGWNSPLGSHHLGSRPLSSSSSPKGHIFIVVYPVAFFGLSGLFVEHGGPYCLTPILTGPNSETWQCLLKYPQATWRSKKVTQQCNSRDKACWQKWMKVELRNIFWTVLNAKQLCSDVCPRWCWAGSRAADWADLALEPLPHLWALASECPGHGLCCWPGSWSTSYMVPQHFFLPFWVKQIHWLLDEAGESLSILTPSA